MSTDLAPQPLHPRETRVPVDGAELYVREIGDGPPIVVLHGGPDFDHAYLLPELDLLADGARLIYYDQRGRGRSAAGVRPEDVGLATEMDDLDRVIAHFRLDSPTLLGHSWGALLAMEYAIRRPGRVGRLVLLNAAPASHRDLQRMREDRQRTAGDVVAWMRALAASPAYASGTLDADAAYYRLHFGATFGRAADLERLVGRLRVNMDPEGIRLARAIEERLYADTWSRTDYDLLPALAELRIPTLVLHGERDLIPVSCAVHIADAIPGVRLVVLEDCGHFAFLERPDAVRAVIEAFVA